ncbi:hypothetical protein Tdes44962_MAKER04414 [Teratosphaeria destructans]|uniref:Uncharacterized protein n=1 Tax=Teratosphaeria destructans TaxID=418781 RepID=A0A9W7SMM4_9PEZI|nr:hypothetical protein Tdes44962_MAKER04414 [Teratosphaeria destructans]
MALIPTSLASDNGVYSSSQDSSISAQARRSPTPGSLSHKDRTSWLQFQTCEHAQDFLYDNLR